MKIGERAPDGSEDDALGRIMFDAIHHGRSAYSDAQRQAWLAAPNAGPEWTARLARQRVLLARENCQPVGFVSLEDDYIDLAFVSPDAQGRGVFRALLHRIERLAEGQTRLWTHASLMAQPAFLALGFRVIRHEEVARRGEILLRAQMEKTLR